MTRKEFIDRVKFRLSLNKWATEQPGYKPPVTDADVEEVMKKLRNVAPLKKPKQPLSDLAKLKYSYLKQVISGQKVVVVVGKENIEKLLLEEKMLALLKNKGQGNPKEFKVTDLGRRYVEHSEKEGVKEK